MNTQHLHDLALEDARLAVASIQRLDYENAYRNAKAVCENLLLLIEEEMYKKNDNSEMFEKGMLIMICSAAKLYVL